MDKEEIIGFIESRQKIGKMNRKKIKQLEDMHKKDSRDVGGERMSNKEFWFWIIFCIMANMVIIKVILGLHGYA